MSEARVGQQTGMPATALTNQTLCCWRRSRFGVFAFGSPAKPNAWARHWSGRIKRMFGRDEGSAQMDRVMEQTVRASASFENGEFKVERIVIASRVESRVLPGRCPTRTGQYKIIDGKIMEELEI